MNTFDELMIKYNLDETDVVRLRSENDLIMLRIDFCLHKFEAEKNNLYDLIVFYGGLDRFTKYLSDSEKNNLKKTIEDYNVKINKNNLDEKSKSDLTNEIFFNSDYVKDICKKVKKERCFNYDIWNKNGASLHFTNSVVPRNPFEGNEFENRKKELKNIAKEISHKYQKIDFIFSVSWMWNLDIFQKLMPEEFNKSLSVYQQNNFYSMDYWGQFYRFDGSLNYERIERFKANWEFPMLPLLGKCSKQSFFDFYIQK